MQSEWGWACGDSTTHAYSVRTGSETERNYSEAYYAKRITNLIQSTRKISLGLSSIGFL